MRFKREQIKDFYLLDSQIENIFINEYLPSAPGDYVKVYVYACMYAEFGMELSDRVMARQLGIPEKKIADAWDYWEKMGVIRKIYLDEEGGVDFTVEFVNLKELMYGKSTVAITQEEPVSPEVFGNDNFRKMFRDIERTMGRSLSSTEVTRILSWVTDDGITPEVILYGITYCEEKGKQSLRYMDSVIHGWAAEGLSTVDAVKDHLTETDQRHYQYRRVLQALGFNRNASEAERKMMDTWFDTYGYNMDRVLEACARTVGISNPNFSYVNKVLENWKNEAARRGDDDVNKKVVVSQAQLKQYYEYLRNKANHEAEARTQEVYSQIPRIREIDNRIQELGAILSRALIMGNEGEQGPEIRAQMDELSAERAVLLTENNYEMDYTDLKYYCDKCHDTGITDMGERCSCVPQRTEEAEVWLKQKGM